MPQPPISSSRTSISRRAVVAGTVGAAAAAVALPFAAPSAHAEEAVGTVAPQYFEGTAMGRAGDVTLGVVYGNGCILGIDVVKSSETPTISEMAIQKVGSDIVRYQSLAVDTVAGATLTSLATINAVRNALEEAGVDTEPFSAAPAYPEVEAADTSCDVVVAGAGSAGMMAALQAAAAGKKVIVVEKQGILGGGDSMFASTGLPGGGGYLAYKAGVENGEQGYLDAKLAAAEKSGLPVDLDNLAAYSMMTDEAADYYISIGVSLGNFNPKTFAIGMDDGSAPGVSIIKRLGEQLDRKGVDYRLDTKLVSIVTDEAGAVTGIEVQNPGGTYVISAPAVILATGGFGNNEDMLAEYADAADFCGLPHTGAVSAMGEGILAAKEVGAAWGDLTAIKANNLGHVASNGAVISLATIQTVAALVNDEGMRFVNESGTPIHDKSKATLLQPNKEAWAVFDQKAMDAKALLRGYDALGYFESGETLEELAAAMGFDEAATANFVATIGAWQQQAEGDADETFGGTVLNAYDQPPFYAALVQPAMQSTYGGVKTDPAARVLNEEGTPIPGLYAAGAVSGHECYGNVVGNGLTIAATFGMIAGQTAAADLDA